MSREVRAAIAAETDRLVLEGRYGPVPESLLYPPDVPLPPPGAIGPSTIEVTSETTLAATARLAGAARDPVACLNFASAKKPGGGYRSGAQAQEESLARASALAAALRTVPDFYEFHRRNPDLRYSDRVIYSPNVAVFRDDNGRLVDPYPITFLTAAAPNAGALPGGIDLRPVLRRRAARVLGVAHRHGHRRLVLGAWGCGVFRNDPKHVAAVFAEHLASSGGYGGRFDLVVFAVPDGPNRVPFQAAFGGSA